MEPRSRRQQLSPLSRCSESDTGSASTEKGPGDLEHGLCAGMAAEDYRASHILVKYDGSSRKASWRDPDGNVISQRTRRAAASTLKELLAELRALEGPERAARFAELAQQESDCGTAKEGGDLGKLEHGEMMEEFEEAVLCVSFSCPLLALPSRDSAAWLACRPGRWRWASCPMSYRRRAGCT